ncbi:MAG: flagellar assembly protein FliX [Alphaproteobacteria bacterium]
MKITQAGSTAGASTAKRADKAGKGTGAGAFAGHLQKYLGEVEEPSGAEAPTALASVDALIAAQTATEDDGRSRREMHRRMVQRGAEILDRLEEVRQGLLTGAIPKERLAGLAQLMRTRREQGVDPDLAAILDEIELRAEVELAKLTRRTEPGA